STLYNLLEAMIQLTERNQREHKVFSQELKAARDSLRDGFNNFAAETQKAYQQLRKEVHGEKRVSLALLNELLEVGQDLHEIASARPAIKERLTAAEVGAAAARGRGGGGGGAEGAGGLAPARHPPLRRGDRLGVQPGVARARGQPPGGGDGSAAGGRAAPARLRQPAARVRPAQAPGLRQ